LVQRERDADNGPVSRDFPVSDKCQTYLFYRTSDKCHCADGLSTGCSETARPATIDRYFNDALIFTRYSAAFCRICASFSVRIRPSLTTGLPLTITSRTSSAFSA
jgi:hypothetical protein